MRSTSQVKKKSYKQRSANAEAAHSGGYGFQQMANCLRVDKVLLAHNSRSQTLGRVTNQHRYNRLGQNGAVVEVSCDPVHSCTSDLASGIYGLLMGVEPLKGR